MSSVWIEVQCEDEDAYRAFVHPHDDYGPIFTGGVHRTVFLAESEARLFADFNGARVSEVTH